MQRNSKKLEEKLKKHNQKPKMSKKQERKVKRKVRAFRKLQRAHHEATMQPMLNSIEEELERERIIREVEAGET
jgi:biopolymer transport protein ExbB/TolQ